MVFVAPAPSGPPAYASTAELPPLHLVAPAHEAHLLNPVFVVLETPADLSQYTMGKGTSTAGMHHMGPHVHLHIVVDGTTYMPVAAELRKIGPARYQYRIPGPRKLSRGRHTVSVYWGDDQTHRPAGPEQRATFLIVA